MSQKKQQKNADKPTKTDKLKRLLPLILILTISVVIFTVFGEYLTLDYLQNNKEAIFEYKHDHVFLSAVGFTIFYAVATFLSLPFGSVLAILGGYLFDVFLGLTLVTFGATIGATGIFMVSRYSLKGVVPKHMSKFYDKAKDEFEKNEVSYLLFLRLVPIFPFAVVNILPALFKIKLRTYVLTTFFGIIPGTLAFVYLGSSFEETTSFSELISMKTIGAFTLLGLLSILPILIKRYKKK